MNNNCVDNSHFFRWSRAINHGTPRSFGGLLMMYPVDDTTRTHKNTQRYKERNEIPSSCWDTMVFPACPWFSMRIRWFWWKCDAAHWISTINSTKLHSLSLKEYSRDVVSGRFHYQSYFEVQSTMVMVIRRMAMEHSRTARATVLWYSTSRLLHQQYYINYMYEWEFWMYSLGPTEKHTFHPVSIICTIWLIHP